MPSGAALGWHRAFSDSLVEHPPLRTCPTTVASAWDRSYSNGLKDTTKSCTEMPSEVVSVVNGVITIHLHTKHGVHMVAALIPTSPGVPGKQGSLLYGRQAVGFSANAVPGHTTALLAWPAGGIRPGDGEINFPAANLTGMILGFFHHQGGVFPADQTALSTSVPDAGGGGTPRR